MIMRKKLKALRSLGLFAFLALGCFCLFAGSAHAKIDGISGMTTIDLVAKEGFISTPDPNIVYTWSYAIQGGALPFQFPGPTLIFNQGDVVTINLLNELSIPTSIVFPGQENVSAVGGTPGLIATEAAPINGTVSYTFTAANPGTYLYHSGTRPELQVEMGLYGAIIVRPTGFDPNNPRAYEHADSEYDYEYLFLLSEMDPRIHVLVQFAGIAELENRDYLSDYFPNYWFINGRCAPDTMFPNRAAWLPHQPYNCMPRTRPGEKLLLRIIGAGRDLHPYHLHGNHVTVIARNGRLLESAPLAGADLRYQVFTVQSHPGETVDATWEWTGAGMGWDIYGHAPGDALEPGEDPNDHGKPFPVTLPEQQDLTFGGFWSGSPFLGAMGRLPPGEGGLNVNGGFMYMWHSHSEKEMCNYDIFPGGMMTIAIVEPNGVVIPK